MLTCVVVPAVWDTYWAAGTVVIIGLIGTKPLT